MFYGNKVSIFIANNQPAHAPPKPLRIPWLLGWNLLSNTLAYRLFVCRRICTAFYEARSNSRSCRLRMCCFCTSKSILRVDIARGTIGTVSRCSWRKIRCPGFLSVSGYFSRFSHGPLWNGEIHDCMIPHTCHRRESPSHPSMFVSLCRPRSAARADPACPDLSRYPLFRYASPVQCNVGPGVSNCLLPAEGPMSIALFLHG